ncbi:type IV pilin protein [Marichromatium bheemlicum]|uniref:Type IV pilin protein n=1 Tax=Marichromatium bheemlicum TaxID=365339 RepID=A0ABX1IC30_9GAMM|nr:type IV pilin protein [Marichromatium bheemlicum]NKN33651.1 type IV pilin protein [Marichromatium bheemlicum]
MRTRRPDSSGFSLIELLIAVAIVGILAAIAYPSYQDSVRKSRRADARAVLLEGTQWMQRFYTENYRYDRNKAGSAVADLFPTSLEHAPQDGNVRYYTIALTTTRDTFSLTATPTTSGGQHKDRCGDLSINQTGAKDATGGSVEQCW